MTHIETNILIGGPKDGERIGPEREISKNDFPNSKVFYLAPEMDPVMAIEGEALPDTAYVKAETTTYVPLRIYTESDIVYWIYASVDEFGAWAKPAEVIKKLIEGYHPTRFENV